MAVDRSIPTSPPTDRSLAFAMQEIQDELTALWDRVALNLTVGGTGNAITGAHTPALTAYVDGQQFTFKASANNTGAVTLNIDSVGAKALRSIDDTALTGGEIANGRTYSVIYNAANDRFVIVANGSGAAGPTGAGVPNGGTAGQLLVKQSATDQDTAWEDVETLPQTYFASRKDTLTISTVDTWTNVLSVANVVVAAGESVNLAGTVTIGANANTSEMFIRLLRGATVIGVGDAASARLQVSSGANAINTNALAGIPIGFQDVLPGAGTYTYNVEALINNGTGYINRSHSDTDNVDFGRGATTIMATIAKAI